MNEQNLAITIVVNATPEQAFAAINDPRAWWGQDIVGITDRLGEEWTYRYKDLHFSRQKVAELVPGRKVAWQVVDSMLSFLQDKTEWNGTTIVFDIAPVTGGTEIRFTHVGLAPQIECYDICSDAWTGLITGSLRGLIERGEGDPDSVEKKAA
jgi:uncharacterized protein YndB with AHSA1/START domain